MEVTLHFHAIAIDRMPYQIKVQSMADEDEDTWTVFVGTPDEVAAYMRGRFDLMIEHR